MHRSGVVVPVRPKGRDRSTEPAEKLHADAEVPDLVIEPEEQSRHPAPSMTRPSGGALTPRARTRVPPRDGVPADGRVSAEPARRVGYGV